MPLKLHHLRPAPGAKTAKTRVGRGEGSKGKTVGPWHQGHQGPLPGPGRLRGWPDAHPHASAQAQGLQNPFKVEFQVVNLDKLGDLFPDGGAVTIEDLIAKGAVRKGHPVKVLGLGEISVAVQLSVNAFSGSAKEKIEAAGGTVTVV